MGRADLQFQHSQLTSNEYYGRMPSNGPDSRDDLKREGTLFPSVPVWSSE